MNLDNLKEKNRVTQQSDIIQPTIPQVNDRPKRRIRSFRTLSKQAMKEYAIKKANSSSFEWFDDEEMER